MNNYSEFQVNIFSNNRDMRLHLENSKSKKGHNFVKKNGELPPLLVRAPLLIVKNYSEFQVNIFSNNRDRRQSYENTSTFSSKTAELKITEGYNSYKEYKWFWFLFSIRHQRMLNI